MNRIEFAVSLGAAGYYNGDWTLDDANYDALSDAFIAQAFADWAASLPVTLRDRFDIGGGKSIDVPKWIEDVFDCDSHVRSFGAFLDEALANDAVIRKTGRGAPAFAKFNFTLASGEGHARGVYVNHDGAVRSFDLGMGRIVTETEDELASIMGGESL